MVMMWDVLRWLAAAMDAARNDPGDEGDTVTALSYRRLEVRLVASVGATWVEVYTRNTHFIGNERRVFTRTTSDGVEVRWNASDLGIPTGADWLPVGFVSWMKGGESG